MGGLLTFLGRPDEALIWLRRARRIDPYFGPAWYWHWLGFAHLTARSYEEAITAFEHSLTMPFYVHACITACHAQMGRVDRVRECVAETLRRKLDFSVRVFVSVDCDISKRRSERAVVSDNSGEFTTEEMSSLEAIWPGGVRRKLPNRDIYEVWCTGFGPAMIFVRLITSLNLHRRPAWPRAVSCQRHNSPVSDWAVPVAHATESSSIMKLQAGRHAAIPAREGMPRTRAPPRRGVVITKDNGARPPVLSRSKMPILAGLQSW
jgi:tetratricopeptide (TPR) repeat protein